MPELPEFLVDLQRCLRRGELSAAEALAEQRRQLRLRDARLHVVVRELDPAVTEGSVRGPLAGIGLAHKDIFDLPNFRAGVGVDAGAPAPGTIEAAALQALTRQGATSLATLVMAPHACGATGANDSFERCVNPLDPHAVVGGSSSGSAVAVAGGLAYASLGTDTAGSIRIPAATCGILGLKTTHGLVSLEGVHPLAPSLDSVGILARCADDAEQILAAVAVTGPSRAWGDAPSTVDAARLKVWMPPNELHDDVALAMAHLVREFDATPFESSWGEHLDLSELAEIVLRAEAAATHRASLRNGTALPAVRAIALAGLMMPECWPAGALEDRARRTRDFVRRHLTDHDVFVAPALAALVPDWSRVRPGQSTFEGRQLLALHRFMGFVNYLGLPSLVVPIARDHRSLPISVQLIGRPFSERRLLSAARAIESSGFGFARSSTA